MTTDRFSSTADKTDQVRQGGVGHTSYRWCDAGRYPCTQAGIKRWGAVLWRCAACGLAAAVAREGAGA